MLKRAYTWFVVKVVGLFVRPRLELPILCAYCKRPREKGYGDPCRACVEKSASARETLSLMAKLHATAAEVDKIDDARRRIGLPPLQMKHEPSEPAPFLTEIEAIQ